MDNKKKIIGVVVCVVIFLVALFLLLLNKPVYEVSFISNNKVIETVNVEKNDVVSKPIDPTRDGYTFDGWYLDDELFDFETKITKDITLTAKWTITVDNTNKKKVTVSFDSLGGTDVETQIIEINTSVREPSAPKRDGYKFIEWQLNSKKFDFDTKITENITLKAKWEKVDVQQNTGTTVRKVKYTVVFDTEGGSSIKTQTIESGKVVKKPQDPTKEGFTFKGWYYNNKEYNFNTKVTRNMVLIAKWEKNAASEEVTKYTVVFNTEGGNAITTQTIESGKVATKPQDPTREGFTFKGWYYNNKEYDFSSKVTSNIVLTAKWEKNAASEEVTKYTVVFNTEGGNAIATQTIESGKVATKPQDPIREGFIFKGWYYNNKEYDFSSKVTSNIVLTAKWEEEEITYKIDETDSYYGQVIIFVLKGKEKVDGLVDIETSTGVTKDWVIPSTGYTTNANNIKSISNVRVK